MNLALAEMYVQGVSTRKVIEVLQKLVGPGVSISSTQISRCTALNFCRTDDNDMQRQDETKIARAMP